MFKVTKRISKEFTEDEELERIFSNLKRLHTISMYPHNTVNEGMVLGNLNAGLCGIDKSGREKVFFETNYSQEQYPRVSALGIEECRRRNYCVVSKAIGELIPGGKIKFKELMPLEDFMLYSFSGGSYWLDKKKWAFTEDDWEAPEDWMSKHIIKINQNWSTLNSVDICHKILNIIKKKVMLNKLAGKQNNDVTFIGGVTW